MMKVLIIVFIFIGIAFNRAFNKLEVLEFSECYSDRKCYGETTLGGCIGIEDGSGRTWAKCRSCPY